MKIRGQSLWQFLWKHRASKILVWVLALALLAPSINEIFANAAEPSKSGPCIHHPEHNEECGYRAPAELSPCSHEHDEACGYTATASEICTHEHDETCGYIIDDGQPCNYVCDLCVLNWQWVDEEEMLVWNDEGKLWGLGLPGADENNPVTLEFLRETLPKKVTAETAAGSEDIELTWDFSDFPEDGACEGSYTLNAALTGEYILTEGAPALKVLVELGGGELYVDKMKFLNKWYFISRDNSEMKENTLTVAIEDLDSKTPNEIVKWLKDTVLPTKIGGWVSNDLANDPRLPTLGFEQNTEKKDPFYETTAADDKLYNAGAQWGSVPIDGWNSFPASFQSGQTFTIQAYITPKYDSNGLSYQLYVNSNDPLDYTRKDPAGNSLQDTRYNPDILTLEVTLKDINLSDHTVSAANPGNVTVNLFDYWAKTQYPSAPKGDLLDKSDLHLHEEGATDIISLTPTYYATKDNWNQGINRGHLLLFGDGMIHAGLWNRGAGQNCRYGNTYAGMEGIVKNVLPENGYPELNLAMADKVLTDGTPYRNEKLIKEYNLVGDHNDEKGTAYSSDNIQNLSNTVIASWGKDINTETESLQYLFDPADGTASKTSFTDVKGLFQLDDKGYYYYNMRENFAEFSQNGGNHFILYDAPATLRTDADQSVGNFFPFNTGSEVFNGMDADENLTSTVGCSSNSMNHHLGMTVNIDFRQPANGMLHTSTGNQAMTFEFAGDDDVWVFIDDVLVLDLGGIHSEIYGTIDFSTGDVYIGRAFDSKGIPSDPQNPDHMVTHTTLLDAYKSAKRTGTTSWTGNTFASNTSHTLKMFYLERGNYDSSIALRFNLPPLLYQRIEKVDQDGQPLPGAEFVLHPAYRTNDTNAIRCLYTDDGQRGQTFYVQPDDSETLVTLKTDANGSAVFLTSDNSYFNFADRGDQYYVLREKTAPSGYRIQPVDIVLHYDPGTSMLSVANRWTTGAYACSISNVTAAGQLNYGQVSNGSIHPTSSLVPSSEQEKGLAVAVPLLQKSSDKSWLALYGSNIHGFNSVRINSGGESAWKNAILLAALEQAHADNAASWHLDWDAGNKYLYGVLNDLPGLASRYQLVNSNGDMSIVYALISPNALNALGISGAGDARSRYNALRQYLKTHSTADTLRTLLDVPDGFRFLNINQFNRDFRSLIYIPNERRELQVRKVDQDGRPLRGSTFTLYSDAACQSEAAQGTTDVNGMLVFSPSGTGQEGSARMLWESAANGSRYYLRETAAPAGYHINDTVVPIVVGTYSIYADAGAPDDGVTVMASAGRLTQTMRQFAMDSDVDITLQDITAFMQIQPSDNFQLTGWQDAKLAGTNIPRSMNLHFGKNTTMADYGLPDEDYGLHDEDGGKIYKPFFVTDTGFIRARIQQNYAALIGAQYEGTKTDVNKDNLGETDLTNLFSLLNMVVVTDKTDSDIQTGKLTISKKLMGNNLSGQDYFKNFKFIINLTDADNSPLTGRYYFYGSDRTGYISSGEELILHHDESITILGLPAAAKFTVTEKPESGWSVLPSTGSFTGEIIKEGVFVSEFINTKDPSIPTPPSGPDGRSSSGSSGPVKVLLDVPPTGDPGVPGLWVFLLCGCLFLSGLLIVCFKFTKAE